MTAAVGRLVAGETTAAGRVRVEAVETMGVEGAALAKTSIDGGRAWVGMAGTTCILQAAAKRKNKTGKNFVK